MNEVYIPFNTSSSKNSKQWTGKYLINGKATRDYISKSKNFYKSGRDKFLSITKDMEPPYHIAFHFVRNSKRKFDYINPAQTVQDLMVKNLWIEDDDIHNIVPYFNGYSVSKEKAGVIIRVLKPKEYENFQRSISPTRREA